MTLFRYRGRKDDGRLVSGSLEAGSALEVAIKTRLQGIFVTDIQEITVKPHSFKLVNIIRKYAAGSRSIKLGELASFCRQLSTLLNAGIPIVSSLDICREQASSRDLKRALETIIKCLEEGTSLADSFAMFPKLFPEIFVYMVEAGELGGMLDQVLERLADHLEREHEIFEKIKSALTYPITVLVFSLLTLSIMLTFIMPKIIEVLIGMGVPLPLPTRMVMAASDIFVKLWYLIPVLALALVLLLRQIKAKTNGRWLLDSITLKVPVLGQVFRKIIVARFCRTLGTLLKGGVPITQALEVVQKSTGNLVIARAVTVALDMVRNGHELSRPLGECGVFPPLASRMIAVGEQTGSLDIMMERIGVHYDKEVGIMVSRLSSLIEPLLIVFLGAIVGFIILAVMLPMMSSVVGGFN